MLPENERGRDLVLGDLHGHRSLFERELDKLDSARTLAECCPSAT
jgi:hypothetical protein